MSKPPFDYRGLIYTWYVSGSVRCSPQFIYQYPVSILVSTCTVVSAVSIIKISIFLPVLALDMLMVLMLSFHPQQLNLGMCALLVMEDLEVIPRDEVQSVSVQLVTYNGNQKSAYGSISIDFYFEDGGSYSYRNNAYF